MYGHEITSAPRSLDGCRVLVRMIDGLAFRYHWATEGLRPEDHAFRPGSDCMSMHEIMDHVLLLVFMIKQTMLNTEMRESLQTEDSDELRRATLENLAEVREHLLGLDDTTLATHEVLKRDGRMFPIWNIMNGPLADALTHVGQINSWRRLNANPTPRADVFSGRPPRA